MLKLRGSTESKFSLPFGLWTAPDSNRGTRVQPLSSGKTDRAWEGRKEGGGASGSRELPHSSEPTAASRFCTAVTVYS